MALTNRTGIATRLKLIVPLHIPCTAISFLLLKDAQCQNLSPQSTRRKAEKAGIKSFDTDYH
jgi:hypothetical protein